MLALLILALAPSQTWTVDDDGPADFASIAQAVSQVAPGDVLLVSPGTYAGFLLTQPLSILGLPNQPRPKVNGTARVQGASTFTLAGLDATRIELDDVAGRGRVDDCIAREGIVVERCDQVVVTRTTADVSGYGSVSGIHASQSTVAIVDCVAIGADGQSGVPYGGDAGHGLRLEQDCHAVVAGSTLGGGLCGIVGPFSPPGHSGSGLRTVGSEAAVTGSSSDYVYGYICDWDPAYKGYAIWAHLSSVVWSGVSLSPSGATVLSSGSQVTEAVPPAAYLEVIGTDGPGGTRSIDVFGATGATALVLTSFTPDLVAVPGIEGMVWLDLTALHDLFVVTMAGQDAPASIAVPLPSAAGFEGLALTVQAYVPRDRRMTNPANIVLR